MKSKKIFSLKQIKLNQHFLLYFILFSVVILVLIWLIQVLTFESIFKNDKEKILLQYGNEISNSIESTTNIYSVENQLKITQLSEENITTEIVYMDNNGTINYLYPMSEGSINENSPIYSFYETIISNSQDTYVISECKLQETNFIYYIKKVNYSNTTSFLILYCNTSSIKTTFSILGKQLIIESICVLIISFILSLFISKRLSKPINSISETATKWAKGDKNVEFSGEGYKELEELAGTLNYAKDEIQKSTNLQRDLLANVSHDLKTPLTMIKAYAEMIHDISGDNKEKRDQNCEVIVDEVDRLTSLVNDILNLSKLQSNVDSIEKSEVNISELIETIIYRFNTAYSEKQFKIESDIEPDLFVFVDEKKIETVIYNLIANSLNYTGDDKTISVYLSSKENKIRLEIIDSGKGIDKEKIQTIWTRYMRYSETHKRPVKGTGLGLSIVKTVLDNHNLEYGVISKENIGSNFYVIFDKLDDDKEVNNG